MNQLIQTLVRKLSRLKTNRSALLDPNLTVKIDSKVIDNLRALGSRRAPGITKAGRLSLRGRCNNSEVKVYSTFSTTQVQLRAYIQGLNFKGVAFPPLIMHSDSLVVEEWVEGRSLTHLRHSERAEVINRVGSFLAELKTHSEVSLPNAQLEQGFCYFNNYLLPRIEPWTFIDQVSSFLECWQAEYRKVSSQIPMFISHPDLSLRNLVMDNEGKIFIVDNELLGFGHGWILDGRNSVLANDEKDFLTKEQLFLDHFIALSWRLRLLGTLLDAGRLDRISTILDSA